MRERRNLWSENEDNLLIETVKEYLSNGDSRVSAFKRASEELGRTVGACRARWNSVLKDEAENSESPPKETSLDSVIASPQTDMAETQVPINDLDQVISFLKDYSAEYPNPSILEENYRLKEDFACLNNKNKLLMETLAEKQELFTLETEKYENVLKILSQAYRLLKKEPIRMIH